MSRFLSIACCALVLQGCLFDPESARGFRLPEGDAERGRQAFLDLQCYACHQIPGIDLPRGSESSLSVTLGGSVGRVRTYGELVTSIINPSHKLAPGYEEDEVSAGGRSLMEEANLNEVMTVRQLTDVVTYLQPLYKVHPPAYNPYNYTYPSHP